MYKRPTLTKQWNYNIFVQILYSYFRYTVLVQYTVKTANSEKAIYILSHISFSTNKLKSHMLFTCKTFMLFDFTRKKMFCSRKWLAPLPPDPLFSMALCMIAKHCFCAFN